MKTTIVLAMHGAPPADFPKSEMAELMSSHHDDYGHGPTHPGDQAEHNGKHDHEHDTHATQTAVQVQPVTARDEQIRRQRRARLAAKMRAWPRTEANDPFYAGSYELAEQLARASGCDVLVGFNEFCDPTVPAALDSAVAEGSRKIVVITPMMTRGGEHSELDISSAVRSAQARHPGVEVVYAWPFDVKVVAQFLAAQVRRFLE